MNAETSVKDRYASAALAREQELCCPVQYNQQYLKIIPQEVLEKDYGCGDPSAWLKEGETVLDLGSGVGKICFIAAQVVGSAGKVIGVDMTDEMLAVARRNAPIVAERLGFANVEFRKGRIQDLGLDLNALEQELKERPIQGSSSFLEALALADKLRTERPLIASNSVDAVVSNCVLNLVDPSAKTQLFHEIFRVLKPGGRAIISDIVADREVPAHLQNDPVLYSGCISGAFTGPGFVQAFEEAGFLAIELVKHEDEPWRTVEGIHFRSVTLRAYKLPNSEVASQQQSGISAMYRGPLKQVRDDLGNLFERGIPQPVSIRTFEHLQNEPYADMFTFLENHVSSAPGFSLPLPALSIRKDGSGKCC